VRRVHDRVPERWYALRLLGSDPSHMSRPRMGLRIFTAKVRVYTTSHVKARINPLATGSGPVPGTPHLIQSLR
jgi:hypothetical protein